MSTPSRTTMSKNALLFGLPVAAAIGFFVFVVSGREPPQQQAPSERTTPVRVQVIEGTTFVPHVSGFGEVVPARRWTAVAQVAGRISYVHPRLEGGAILTGGTTIIRIDPTEYQIAVQQADANLKAAQSKLAELRQQAANAEASLAIETKSLDIKRKDIERKRGLVKRRIISDASVEDAERSLLTQQGRVQDLKNTLRLSPAQLEAQQRQIDVNKTQLESAKFNLARTEIKTPYDVRVAAKNAALTQFVGIGAQLAETDGVASAEVTAQLPQSQFRAFVRLTVPKGTTVNRRSVDDINKLIESIGWRAEVQLRSDEGDALWPARVVRTADTVDPKTRTVGAIVAVDDPYAIAQVGARPPLVKGMFTRVTLLGKPIRDQIVVPRSVVRNGAVFVVDEENRLRSRSVKITATQGENVLVADGLQIGDRLVLTDLARAVEGMLLEPRTPTSARSTSAEIGAQETPDIADAAQ
ncbi:MAG: efflux RND transporter periplasmic adaptor subunit [Pseudomonadota bacterium]